MSQVCQEPVILRAPKKCSCGITHIVAPAGSRLCPASHLWFDCSCGSTLVQQSEAFAALKAKAQEADQEILQLQAELRLIRRLVG